MGILKIGLNPNMGKLSRDHMCRWEDVIKRDIREIGLKGAHWIYLAENRKWW
jgi:hypothetical protein